MVLPRTLLLFHQIPGQVRAVDRVRRVARVRRVGREQTRAARAAGAVVPERSHDASFRKRSHGIREQRRGQGTFILITVWAT